MIITQKVTYAAFSLYDGKSTRALVVHEWMLSRSQARDRFGQQIPRV